MWVTIALNIGLALAAAGVNYYIAKRRMSELEDSQRRPGIDDYRFPTVTESDPIPVVFGTRRISGPNVIWYTAGDPRQISRDSEHGTWRYHAALAMVYCLGPVDSVERLFVGDILVDDVARDLSSGSLTVQLDDHQVFGGWQGEGGLEGPITYYPGYSNQSVDPVLNLNKRSGSDITPAHRGVFSVVLGRLIPHLEGFGWSDQVNFKRFADEKIETMYVGTSPVIKPWAPEVKRTNVRGHGDAQWYPDKAGIYGNMNAAHIVHELLTDEAWGLGLPWSALDDVSFRHAANVCYAEGLGLSMLWSQTTTVSEQIIEICRHANAIVDEDPHTGKIRIRLIRDDYDVDLIPALGPSDVMRVVRFNRPALTERANIVDVIYHDRETDRDRTATAHDQAGILTRGEIRAEKRYPGISHGELAARVAARDLRVESAPLASVELQCTSRNASELMRGDVVRWSHPRYGIESMVLRVVNVDRGSALSGAVTLQCVEDVFAWDESTIIPPAPSDWVDPVQPPEDADAITFELPLLMRLGTIRYEQPQSFIGISELLDDARGIACIAAHPPAGAISYELWSTVTGQLPREIEGNTPWSSRIELVGTLDQGIDESGTAYESDTLLWYPDGDGLFLAVGDVLLIRGGEFDDDEELAIVGDMTDLGEGEYEVTLRRAAFDTPPLYRSIEDPVGWIVGRIESDVSPVSIKRCHGQDVPRDIAVFDSVELRALTTTGRGSLPYEDATPHNVDLVGRGALPYPPYVYEIKDTATTLGILWRHRDRTVERITTAADGAVGPEPGIEYAVDIYEVSPTPRFLRTIDGITGAAVGTQYDHDDEKADRGSSSLADELRIEVYATRDGMESYIKHKRLFVR